ncbi:MAG TPA: NADP-dependent oxidoreductase [Puia sp.]|jgi:NADPH:quinone reductase-like Zn-dependent oxidoreductase|nr:NADP-dependent oxidoreductase [Puia sp.]
MKAVEIYHYGGPEELKYEEAAVPAINPGDVLVRVFASGVNPVDWKIRKGGHMTDHDPALPRILGWDFSGVVEKVGSQVKEWKVGDEVYGRPDLTRNGTYAEYVAVRAGEIARKPRRIDHKAAAGVALAALTAWQGLFEHGGLRSGQKVLIHGASGGVGTFAVQFAKWKGAYVIGTASEKNVMFLEELGADEVIDYEKEDFSEQVRDIDVVFDTQGGEVQQRSLKVLKPGGVLVGTVGIQDEKAFREAGIRTVSYMAQSRTKDLEDIAGLIDSGIVIPVISQIFPLKEAAKAHQLGEKGHTRGKIVLQVVE